jgi:hypothetical protein
MASDDFLSKIADFWKDFIDPYGDEKTKLHAFSAGWNAGVSDVEKKATKHTWQGVGYRFGAIFGEADLEEKRQAWRWARKRLREYGWVEVERYPDLRA